MHRTFVRAAVLFALLLLCPALAQATPAPNQYTAADTIGGAHVDIDALRKTAFFKALQREATKERDVADTLNKMKADWRFDPFKDLSGATVFVGPDVNGGKDFLAVFEGKFSEPAIVRHIRSKVGADGLKE
ncbi:MAG: hypothetical protein FJ096_22980, partial [Deltaproteobacteria bacterium]|nr:hypothetical protein [Deltaproteobacteria bacterium]